MIKEPEDNEDNEDSNFLEYETDDRDDYSGFYDYRLPEDWSDYEERSFYNSDLYDD